MAGYTMLASGTRGPMAGQSSLSHRYTSPDLFQSKLIHVRGMIRTHTQEPV